jgi:hypothetical protein
LASPSESFDTRRSASVRLRVAFGSLVTATRPETVAFDSERVLSPSVSVQPVRLLARGNARTTCSPASSAATGFGKTAATWGPSGVVSSGCVPFTGVAPGPVDCDAAPAGATNTSAARNASASATAVRDTSRGGRALGFKLSSGPPAAARSPATSGASIAAARVAATPVPTPNPASGAIVSVPVIPPLDEASPRA